MESGAQMPGVQLPGEESVMGTQRFQQQLSFVLDCEGRAQSCINSQNV